MSSPRDEKGRFLRSLPGDEAFVTITNEKIYERLETMDDRIGRIESRLDRFHGLVALAVPTVTCLAGVATTWYYVRGGK